jgi:hypothetical protein
MIALHERLLYTPLVINLQAPRFAEQVRSTIATSPRVYIASRDAGTRIAMFMLKRSSVDIVAPAHRLRSYYTQQHSGELRVPARTGVGLRAVRQCCCECTALQDYNALRTICKVPHDVHVVARSCAR